MLPFSFQTVRMTHEFFVGTDLWVVSSDGARLPVFCALVPRSPSISPMWVRAYEENLGSKVTEGELQVLALGVCTCVAVPHMA